MNIFKRLYPFLPLFALFGVFFLLMAFILVIPIRRNVVIVKTPTLTEKNIVDYQVHNAPEMPIRIGQEYVVFENRVIASPGYRGMTFPKLPIEGQTFLLETLKRIDPPNGTLYVWNGRKWDIVLTDVGVINNEIIVGKAPK